MNDKQYKKLAVLFADIVGSTRLYEEYGDKIAQVLIGKCLTGLTEILDRNAGTLVKTIGDEIMCHFPTVDEAVLAACEMQSYVKSTRWQPNVRFRIRVGLHWGPTIISEEDVFGDAVNIAARMAGIAKANQIITTEDTINFLSPEKLSMARKFDRASIKGKSGEVTIYSVVWEQKNLTRLNPAPEVLEPEESAVISLRYKNKSVSLTPSESRISIGRSKSCSLVIDSDLVSRTHCQVIYQRGKFVLVDQSTNGSFVKTHDGSLIYLRREDLPLWGEGSISLGEAIGTNTDEMIYFTCV